MFQAPGFSAPPGPGRLPDPWAGVLGVPGPACIPTYGRGAGPLGHGPIGPSPSVPAQWVNEIWLPACLQAALTSPWPTPSLGGFTGPLCRVKHFRKAFDPWPGTKI